MEFFNDPQFLYLMGVLWIINGSVFSVGMLLVTSDDESSIAWFFMLTSWVIGIGHIVYAFIV